jgi:osmotically-inducible protein OsmY
MKQALRLRSIVVCAVCLVFFLVALESCKSATGPRKGNVDDRAIVARIRSLISEDPALNAAAVRVFVQEGKVTLSGPVPDGGAKARLLSEARRVEGVKSVSDNLELPH